MKVREPGHRYEVEVYSPDGTPMPDRFVLIPFFKKIGANFPGNEPPATTGTNCQELLRIVIDRVKYLDGQKPCEENQSIILHLRAAILNFEWRAARLKGLPFDVDYAIPIERIPACPVCGHIFPHSHAEHADATR